MNDYRNINELLTNTKANKSAFVDYLLEYVDGDYHCLDKIADNEIFAFSSFAFKFKHIFALAILLKIHEKIDTSNYTNSFSEEFQTIIQQEYEEFGNLLFYIRHSLPKDLIFYNCQKYINGNGIIQNKWKYPNDILDDLKNQQIILNSKQHMMREENEELLCLLEEAKKELNENKLKMEEKMKDFDDLCHMLDVAKIELEENKLHMKKIENENDELRHLLEDAKKELVEKKLKEDKIKKLITELPLSVYNLAILSKMKK